MKETFLRIERFTSSLAMAGACFMLVVASTLGMFQIITRFVLEQPAEWSEILIRLSLIWMVFLGIPTAFRQGAMVSVDVLYRSVRPGGAHCAVSSSWRCGSSRLPMMPRMQNRAPTGSAR